MDSFIGFYLYPSKVSLWKHKCINTHTHIFLFSCLLTQKVTSYTHYHIPCFFSVVWFVCCCCLRQSLTLHPNWSAMAQSRLTATSTSQVQAILPPHHRLTPPCPTNFCIFVQMGFHHVAQAGLELLGWSDASASASQSAGITVMSHFMQLISAVFDVCCFFIVWVEK